ncbi:MAG TPA: hypothetical protein VF622_15020 [Segetibacter sp.]
MLKRNCQSIFQVAIIISALQLTACTHYYYGPNSSNVPLFKEKGEGRISGALSGADETTGFELQTAYAFGKNFGGMFNFYTAGGKDNTTFDGSGSGSTRQIEKGNGTLTEIGLGYFQPLSASNMIFELYGGIGGGTVNNFYQQNESSKVGLTKLFLQPSIGYSNDERTLEAAFSTRLSSINFKVKEARFATGTGGYDLIQVQYIRNNDNIFFVEPSLLFRGGGKNIKGQLQLTTSHPLTRKEFLTQELNASIGIFFSFNGKAKK